ncbi:UNVERIFIED_CONTAM: VIN3-like protein 2 [Sesamum radiatum]|uniref:VIN3-like protein 2 n=1 Tax=Sesamum radiatum TaxID=300843 RepID=A0AAW2TJM3_SESRA
MKWVLTGLPVKKARGIVNRLSSGPEIQRHCASAVESLDLMLSKRVSDMPSDCSALVSKLVRFEDIHASSITVILNNDDSNGGGVMGYVLWHRKADEIIYPTEPTCRLFAPNTKLLLSGLTPATEYFLKVVTLDKDREKGFCEFQFRTASSEDEVRNLSSKSSEVERSQSPATNCSTLSNPSSVEDETNNVMPCSNEDENRGDNYLPFSCNDDKNAATNLLSDSIICSDPIQKETNGDEISLLDEENSMGKISCIPNSDPTNFRNKESSNGRMVEETSPGNRSNIPLTGLECVPYVDSSEAGLQITPCKLENLKNGAGWKNKRKNGKGIDAVPERGTRSSGWQLVKEEKWRETRRGLHRQKFLTWYSFRATPQEVQIVKVFIDTFIEDPESLAAQLVDSFTDIISNKRCSTVPSGFCLKLWH